jgi:Fic family protein
MEEIIQALHLKSELDALRPMDKEQEDRIMQKFRLDWNYHSNHLEGNSLTYGETKALILFGVTAPGKPLKDTLEIKGHNEAINWVLEMIQGDRPLTENFIRELHSLLLQDSYKESKNAKGEIVPRKITVGQYKTSPNHVQTVTGEIFYFATPEETPAKMTELLEWYKEKASEKEVNPILVAAEFHYKFIRIHPFDDGNGRTARILMNFILMQFGFPPVIIKTEDKANYFAALQMADAGNIESFVTYIAQNLNRSLEIMIAGANGENIEEDDDLDKQIALLEQRLENTYVKVKMSKELTLLSISSLLDVFIKKNLKFKNLYGATNCFFWLEREKLSSKEILIETLKTLFDSDRFVTFIIVEIHFIGLKQENNQSINFTSRIHINFDSNKYEVYLRYNSLFYDKPRATQLTDFEIDQIVKSEIKRHKEFIEQKIAEKEDK